MASGQKSKPEPFDRFLEGLETGRPEGLESGQPSPAQLGRMRAFLRERYDSARPVASRVRHGQVYDYFPLEDQPATRRHGLAQAVMPPAGFLGGKHKVGLQFKAPRSKALQGLVPLRRLMLADLAPFGSLDRFLHKRGSARRSLLRGEPASAPATNPTHRWADVYQAVANTGANAVLNVWRPTLAPGQTFSLSQIWCVANGPYGKQTAEVGWHVYPALTGHTEPALFCYWTRDGYQQTGSYNGANADFKICTQNTVLGAPIT